MKCFTAAMMLLAASFAGAEQTVRFSSKTHHGRRLEANDGDMYRLWIHYIEGHDSLVQEVLGANGREVNYDMQSTKTLVVTVDEAGYNALEADDRIDIIDVDTKRAIEKMPDDYNNTPEVAKQIQEEMERLGLAKPANYSDEDWHHERQRRLAQSRPYGIDDSEAPLIWEEASKGAGVKVCVLDTGMYVQHEDFDFGRFTGELTNAQGSTSWPWNEDGHSHGTHVTGTIAALDNTIGVVGVAPDVDVHVVRVFSNGGSYIWSSDVADAAERCVAAGARVVNMSLGGGGSSSIESRAWDDILAANVLPIAAAGNSGSTGYSYPASYPSVMSVAAVNNRETLASFSTRNDRVEIAAAGVGVVSSVIGAPDRYAAYSGTSMATPHVAGAAALLMAARPHATAKDVREALTQGAQDTGSPGRDNEYGFGLLRVAAALERLDEINPPPEPSAKPTPQPVARPTPRPTDFPTASPVDVTPPTQLTDVPSLAPATPPDEDTCEEGKVSVVIEVNGDATATEITTQIVRDDLKVVHNKNNYKNNRVKVVERCYNLNRCWTFNVLDDAGNGMAGGSVRLIVDGEVVFDESDFGEAGTATFGNCDAEEVDKECSDGQSLIEITARTDDDAPLELATQIERSDHKIVFSKANYKATRIQKTSRCFNLQKNCYTFSASDSGQNGLANGYVKLEIDNEEKLFASDFGTGEAAVSYEFGQCEFVPRTCNNGKTPVTIRVRADGEGSDLTTKIIRQDEFAVYEKNGFTNGLLKTVDRCYDLDKCWRFEVLDAAGNGVAQPGYVAVDIDNVERYRVSDFGSMGVYEFGDCSPPEDKVCTNPNHELAKVTVRTDGSPAGIETMIMRTDGKVVFEKKNYKRDRIHTKQKCLNTANNCFAFFISDDAGNGLEDPGYFKLEVGGELLLEESDFGSRATTQFGNCENSESVSVASCGAELDTLRVVVKTDDNGSETAVSIFGDSIAPEVYDGLESNSEYVFETCVTPGMCHSVEVSDTGGDGLCCSSGTGYASVYLNDELIGQMAEFGSTNSVSSHCYTLN